MARDRELWGVHGGLMEVEAIPVQPSAEELLHALGHAVFATDLNGTVVSWNVAAEELYGWPTARAIGKHVAEVTSSDVFQQRATDVALAVPARGSWSGGFSVRRRGGEVLHALVTDSGVYHQGKLIGIVCASLDLGDAVRHLMERSSDAAVLLDEHRDVSYASPAVTHLFGWPVDGVIGGPLTDLVHPEDRGTLNALLAADPGQADRVGELRVRVHDSWSWVEVAVADLEIRPGSHAAVCNIRRSERLARVEERERLLEAVHSEVLQELFAAGLQLDRALTRASPPIAAQVHAARDAVERAMRTLREVVKP